MAYVDGFLLAVPDENRAAYLRLAETAAEVFRDHGALRLVECWGNDVPEGHVTSFPMAVKRAPGETVVFAWIEWPSKEVRDAAHPKVMADPRLDGQGEIPFDGKRMIFGGFEVLLDR
ncbi:MAG: DUF1428 domain-containing protein [Rhodobacteraceae bacterium]|nr:DUF1428 domain-containing protein [Paracoccaceae bacterium]